jgi:Domain of unknown function (DUF4407)
MKEPRHKAYSVINWLCKFSGEDYQLIHDANTTVNVRARFAIIGAFVLVIFLIAGYSCAHFIYKLFNHNTWAAVAVGLLWAFTVVNLYLLLLYTITPPMLRGKERAVRGVGRKVTTENPFLANFSMSLRIAFVVLLGVIIAQPWIVSSFSGKVAPYLEASKQQYRNSFIVHADSILIVDESEILHNMMRDVALIGKNSDDSAAITHVGATLIRKIEGDFSFYNQAALLLREKEKVEKIFSLGRQRHIDSLSEILTMLVSRELLNDSIFIADSKVPESENPYLMNILATSHQNLMKIIYRKNEQYLRLNEVLRSSNFYVRKIQLINSRFPLSWIMTVGIVFLFVIPILAKYRIRNKTNYYEVKKQLENTGTKPVICTSNTKK